jgi:hypothetical protein
MFIDLPSPQVAGCTFVERMNDALVDQKDNLGS